MQFRIVSALISVLIGACIGYQAQAVKASSVLRQIMSACPALDILASVETEDIMKALGDLTVLDLPSTASVPSLPFDARESNTTYEIHCDLPGIEKKDISLVLKENELTISASRNTLAKEEGVIYRRAERHTGEVSRTIILPEDCEKDKIVAQSKDGVLVITIPKMQKVEEAANTIQIEVR